MKAVWQAGAKAAAAGRAEAAATPPRRMAAAASILGCDMKRAEERASLKAQFEAGTRHTIGGAEAKCSPPQAASNEIKVRGECPGRAAGARQAPCRKCSPAFD